MDDAAYVGARDEKANYVRDDLCRCRVAALVVDDLERRPLLGAKLGHRVNEARSAGAVEPRDAEYGRIGQDHVDHLLARELRRAVDGARTRNVGLAPCPRLARGLAGEDVVGGDCDKPRTRRLARKRNIARTLFIELEREIPLRLAVVDLRHRRAVDHDVGRFGDCPRRERVRVKDVPLGQVRDNELVPSLVPLIAHSLRHSGVYRALRLKLVPAAKLPLERAAQHPLAACYQNLHSAASFSLASRLACVMHAPSRTICQLMYSHASTMGRNANEP